MKRFGSCLAILGLLSALPAVAEEPLALLDGEPIAAADVPITPNQWKLEQQLYEVRHASLAGLIATQLIEREAARRDMTVSELIETEILPKIGEPTNKEVSDLYNAQRAKLNNQPLKEVREVIVEALKRTRRDRHLSDMVQTLEADAEIEFLLEPPRRPVDLTDVRAQGPDDAAVTVVEYADFQCPYCRRMQPVIAELREEYKDRVRWVFKDMPLTDVHPEALKAAKAARCADEIQDGRFWDYKDKLFEQELFTDAMYGEVADGLGLNGKKLLECVNSDRHEEAIGKERTEAAAFGIEATPAYLVNGILVLGARPAETFRQILDSELESSEDMQSTESP